MKTLLILTSLVALTACGKAGLHEDRCQQYLNDEGRWVYSDDDCPMIGGGGSLTLPKVTTKPYNPPPPPVDPKPEPDKPKPKDPKKNKKPKSDNSDSNGKGGNHHDRTDKPQGPKEKRDDT